MAKDSWRDIVAKGKQLGLGNAELARKAGIPEDTVARGVHRNSSPYPSTRRLVNAALAQAEQEQVQ